MSAADPSDRRQIARMGGYAQKAKHDPRETTRAARSGFNAKFLREVDPDGVLPEPERVRRAEAAKQLHMLGLSRKAAEKRKKLNQP